MVMCKVNVLPRVTPRTIIVSGVSTLAPSLKYCPVIEPNISTKCTHPPKQKALFCYSTFIFAPFRFLFWLNLQFLNYSKIVVQ